MTYFVIFYSLTSGNDEVVIATHQVNLASLPAYMDAPDVTLTTIRKVLDGQQVDGFMVVNDAGAVVLNHRDKG